MTDQCTLRGAGNGGRDGKRKNEKPDRSRTVHPASVLALLQTSQLDFIHYVGIAKLVAERNRAI